MNANKIIAAGVIAAALVVGQVAGRWLHQPLDASVAPSSAATLTVPTAAELSSRFSEVSAEVDPAVVNINTETVVKHRFRWPGRGGRGGQPFGEPFDFFHRYFGGGRPPGPSQKRQSLGSGFVVDPKGTILTNYHVVNGADEIRVELASGEEFPAKLVGGDNFTDLAVIEIDAGKPLATAKLGNSDGMRRGDWVLAIGSPFGLERTITAGIISATARPGRSHWQRFLQTDAAINQGNSGGPLVNLAGEVIGVNTAILTSSGDNAGIGFAVPSNTAIQVYNQIVKHGRVTRGALGISMQTEAKPQALKALGATDGKGVIVQQVRPKDGPADRAGLQPGDVIVEMKGHKIGEPADVYPLLAETAPGETIEVQYLRDGRKRTARLTVGDRAEVFAEDQAARPASGQGADSLKLGLRVQGLPDPWKRQLGAEAGGVLIMEVEPGSVADDAGLRPGDVLVELDKTAVSSPARLAELVGELQPGTDVLFLVKRGQPGSGETVTLYLAATLP